jgi:hypothetical protein
VSATNTVYHDASILGVDPAGGDRRIDVPNGIDGPLWDDWFSVDKEVVPRYSF